jgi:glycine dehydrogenase
MVSIKRECEQSAHQTDSVVVNAPHTSQEIASDEWAHPYTREQAAFPAPWTRESKFFPVVTKIDNGYGDRNLFCTCAPLYEIENA